MEADHDRPGHGRDTGAAAVQENFVLVHATDERSARERVERRAREAETSYLNDRQETVTWRLRAIVDGKEAEDTDLGGDADLYMRHFRDWAAYERVEPLLARESDGAWPRPATRHGPGMGAVNRSAAPGYVPGM